MRRAAALALATAIATACGSGALFRQYEYEEEIFLSLDGSATVYVNTSVAALDALRGASFDTSPGALVDTARVRELYASPATRVRSVTWSRRSGRRFVHVRLDVDDVRRLSEAAPFAWSTYGFARDGNLYRYSQTVGRAAEKDVGDIGWTGREIVAFRLHLPSKVRYHNTTLDNPRRGNILVWEQTLDDRRRSRPLTLDARMDPQSILYWTLQLFGATFAAVALMFGVLVWWILRRGAHQGPRTKGGPSTQNQAQRT